MKMHKVTTTTFDWYEGTNVEESFYISDETMNALKNVTEEELYNHLKAGVGKMTVYNSSKLLPTIKVGEIILSLQLNYQLWNLRMERSNDEDCMKCSNAPMTEEEFEMLVSSKDSIFDFWAHFERGRQLLDPQGASIHSLMNWMKGIYQDKRVEPWIH